MDLNLTSEEWAELYALRHSETASAPVTDSALDKVLAHRPAPDLPAGWVLYRHVDGSHRVVWHEAGQIYIYDDRSMREGSIYQEGMRDILTPLRVLAGDEVAVKLGGYFVAEDGGGDLAIWREREGKDPVPALYRYYATSGLFDVLAAALPHRDDEADR